MEKCDLLICDRSILDTYSYECSLLERNKAWELLIQSYLQTYDLLIRVPIKPELLRNDGIRSLDKKFQQDVSKEIETNLKRFNPNYIDFKGEESMKYLIKKFSE